MTDPRISTGNRTAAEILGGGLPISCMADNLILLDMRGEEATRRTIRVLKARGTGHDASVRPFVIAADGIRIT